MLFSFQDALAKFTPKFSETCPQNKESLTFCPLEPCHKKFVLSEELAKYILKHAPDVPLAPESQHLLQVEQQLLSLPAIRDLRETPSLTLSTLTSLDRDAGDGVVRCMSGDVIRVRADLVDEFGRQRTLGHDDVRAWIVEHKRKNSGLPRRAGAEVTDLKNGSYVASFRCLWAGLSYIHVSVAYPREYLALVLRSRKAGISRYSTGLFNNSRGQTEMTPCFSTPNLPWPCLCNLTAWNDASFYCGRPRDPGLTCNDLKGMGALPTRNEIIGMSPVEMRLIAMMSRPAVRATIQTNLTLDVSEGENSPAVDSPCRQAGTAITWTAPSPKGYFDDKGVWQTSLCHPTSLTPTRLKSCLTNTTVWFLGDSNAMRLRDVFKDLLRKNKFKHPTCSMERPQWYAMETCLLSDFNGKFHYMRHEHNFYFSKGLNTSPVYRDKSLFELIDSLPSTERLVVVVHYFLHTICAHLSVVHDRLVKVRAAMVRLARRNPSVVFALRGPHVSYQEWKANHLHGGDTQALFYLEMIKDVFRDMHDKVVFLDGWDMSIAIEEDLFHPPNTVPRDMLNLLLEFACD